MFSKTVLKYLRILFSCLFNIFIIFSKSIYNSYV